MESNKTTETNIHRTPNVLETLTTLEPGAFIPHRYIVGLKEPERCEEHLEQLKARVADAALLELKVGQSKRFYSATVTEEEVLEWVKGREEVRSVSQDRKAKLS